MSKEKISIRILTFGVDKSSWLSKFIARHTDNGPTHTGLFLEKVFVRTIANNYNVVHDQICDKIFGGMVTRPMASESKTIQLYTSTLCQISPEVYLKVCDVILKYFPFHDGKETFWGKARYMRSSFLPMLASWELDIRESIDNWHSKYKIFRLIKRFINGFLDRVACVARAKRGNTEYCTEAVLKCIADIKEVMNANGGFEYHDDCKALGQLLIDELHKFYEIHPKQIFETCKHKLFKR